MEARCLRLVIIPLAEWHPHYLRLLWSQVNLITSRAARGGGGGEQEGGGEGVLTETTSQLGPGPIADVQVTDSTFSMILGSLDSAVNTLDHSMFRLGRYSMTFLLDMFLTFVRKDNNYAQRLLDHHFTIIRTLMNVLRNFLEGIPANKAGGGPNDHAAVAKALELLTLVLSPEIETDEELGIRLQSYGLGALLYEVIERQASADGTGMLFRLKNWGKGSAILPKPASTLKKEILTNGAVVMVDPPPEPWVPSKGQKRKTTSSEITQAHEYYKLKDGRGFLKIESEEHCFVPISLPTEETKEFARILLLKLPLQDSFGASFVTYGPAQSLSTAEGGIVIPLARPRTVGISPDSPTLDRRDGLKDGFGFDYLEMDEIELNASFAKSRPSTAPATAATTAASSSTAILPFNSNLLEDTKQKHIMISYAKGCENEANIKFLAKCVRSCGYRVYCDDGQIGFKLESRKEEAMDQAPIIIVCVSKKYHNTCREEAAYARLLAAYGKTQLVYCIMNENYHTDSHPFRVSGWLGNMLAKGGTVWFPCWTAFHAGGSAQEISSIVQRTIDLKTIQSMTRGKS